ncbi:MAG TPA: hypothetical protein VFV26_04420 [Geothrix sp.]|jgi:hypothetical protein|nr:hypothetical protein [Geothrix sp.]
MADVNRKPILDRATALLAGPFLLGQRALGLAFLKEEGPPPDAAPRISITPPDHAIKRRG